MAMTFPPKHDARDIHINLLEDGRFALGAYRRDGSLACPGRFFSSWAYVLRCLDRYEREGYDLRVFVRTDLAVNTPDGLVF